jgi:hypothetical protein
MKKLIILTIIYFTLFVVGINLEAQIMANKTKVKRYNSENRTELIGELVGDFNVLDGVWGTDNIADTLSKYFNVGFYFEGHNTDGNYINEFKPMGYVAYTKRKVPEDEDTVVFRTDLTNIILDTNYYCYASIVQRPNMTDNTVVKFRIDGTENEGQLVQDIACEPQLTTKQVQSEKWIYDKGDTVTFYVEPFAESWCDTNFTYEWYISVPDSVDSLNNAITYKNEYKWTDARQGSVSYDGNSITFEVLWKNWNDRKWRVEVTNSLGTVSSWYRKLKVNQGE